MDSQQRRLVVSGWKSEKNLSIYRKIVGYPKSPWDTITHTEEKNYSTRMPLPSSAFGHGQAPSCFDKMKTGFIIGFCVGMASGALFGGFSALRYGLRGRELINNVGKVMVQGGGTFGTFMAIGTGIRCWELYFRSI